MAELPENVFEMLRLAGLEAVKLDSGRWGVYAGQRGVILEPTDDYDAFARAAKYLIEARGGA